MPKNRSEILEFLEGLLDVDENWLEDNSLNQKSSQAKVKLFNDDDYTYLRNNGVEIYNYMIANESRSQFPSLLQGQEIITR